MDAVLQNALASGAAPFNGVVIYDSTDELMPVDRLRPLAAALVETLHDLAAGSQLFILDDWHEHDGFVTTRTVLTWNELEGCLGSDSAFLFFSTGDHLVSKAVYPGGMQYLLRVYLDIESLAPHGAGSIDITVPGVWELPFTNAFKELGFEPRSESAVAYFGRHSGA